MAIERNDGEERQARVDQMITEFQEARQRRLARAAGVPLRPRPQTQGDIEPVAAANSREPGDERDV